MTGKSAKKKIKEIMYKYLSPEDYQIFLFGSRASGSAEKFSDFDIGVKGGKPLPSELKVLIEEELEESSLPFIVDIVDFSLVSDNFKKVSLSNIKKL